MHLCLNPHTNGDGGGRFRLAPLARLLVLSALTRLPCHNQSCSWFETPRAPSRCAHGLRADAQETSGRCAQRASRRNCATPHRRSRVFPVTCVAIARGKSNGLFPPQIPGRMPRLVGPIFRLSDQGGSGLNLSSASTAGREPRPRVRGCQTINLVLAPLQYSTCLSAALGVFRLWKRCA